METPVNINDQQAKESLEMIHQTTDKTKKAVSSSYSSPMLILWGSVWIAAYTACHFYVQYAYWIFMVMNIVGGVGSGIIVWWYNTKAPIKVDSSNPLGKKIFWFWFSLFVYIAIWMKILSPFNGLQLNAVLVTAVMFAYIVMGLFYETPFLTIIGIFVTAATLLGYYVFTPYYCLWLAVCGGGAFLGTGVYIRLKWR